MYNKSLHWIFTPLRCVKTSEFTVILRNKIMIFRESTISFQQKQMLIVQQALLGAISSNVRLITLCTEKNKILIKCILETNCKEDHEEFEDLVAEIEAMQDGPIDVSVEIEVNDSPIYLGNAEDIPIYRRKE